MRGEPSREERWLGSVRCVGCICMVWLDLVDWSAPTETHSSILAATNWVTAHSERFLEEDHQLCKYSTNVAIGGFEETNNSFILVQQLVSCPVSDANACYSFRRLGAVVTKLPYRFVMGNLDVVKIEKLLLE